MRKSFDSFNISQKTLLKEFWDIGLSLHNCFTKQMTF